jgi:hypothetical protein
MDNNSSSTSTQTAKAQLRSLQKKLIINNTNAQGFYSKFSSVSSKIMDLFAALEYMGYTPTQKISTLFINGSLDFRTAGLRTPASQVINRLKKIYTANDKVVKETDVDSLYFAWPYIGGNIDKINFTDFSQAFRAPLLL